MPEDKQEKQIKLTKTQQKIQDQYDLKGGYGLMPVATGITARRLSQIRRGVGEKPTRSEVSRISRWKIEEKKVGDQITIADIKKSTGASDEEIRAALASRKNPITKKTLSEDGTYILKTKDNTNYRLYMRIYVNMQTKEVEVGLNKRPEFRILGDTGTRYEDNIVNGRRYSFAITVFQLHQYTDLKGTVKRQIERVLSADESAVENEEIDTLLSITGYV